MIDDEVFEAASQIARSSGQRVGQVISELAKRGLNPPPTVQIVQSGRFPTFALPPDSPKMDAELVESVLNEEGF